MSKKYTGIRVKLSHPDKTLSDLFLAHGFIVTNETEKADLLAFGGGADIVPFLYGEFKHKTTNPDLTRDLKEIKLFKAVPKSLPKVGICRGGQLLNTLSGGSLYQDVDNHTQTHLAYDIVNAKTVSVTSTHHQMMRPSKDALVLATAGKSSKCFTDQSYDEPYHDPNTPESWEDTEAVYYADTNSLCFQPHPEYGNKDCENYFWDLFDAYTLPQITLNRTVAKEGKR